MILDIKKLSQSKSFKAIIAAIIGLAVVLAIFQAGVFVGFHKASFLFKSGDNFYRVFGDKDDMRPDMGMGMFRDEMSGGHGVVGKIIKVNLPTIVVMGPDNIEKIILLDEKTSVHMAREIASINALAIDQYITVLGTPNDQGQIVAKFIRMIPPPPSNILSTSTANIK